MTAKTLIYVLFLGILIGLFPKITVMVLSITCVIFLLIVGYALLVVLGATATLDDLDFVDEYKKMTLINDKKVTLTHDDYIISPDARYELPEISVD